MAAAGLLWLLRKGGELEALGPHPYAIALRVAARLSAAVLLIAVGSNVIGNVSLAQFLTSGVLSSSYLLLVVLTAVQVADGVLIVATRSEAAGVSRYVSQRKDTLVRSGLRVITLVAAAGWVVLTLWLFELWRPTVSLAGRVLDASLSFGELSVSLGSALVFVATVWVSVMVSRALSSLLEVDVLSRLDMPRGLPSVIGRLTRYTLIALGFLFALAAIGVELTQLAILGGALGVGIGFGLQNVVSNFVSGLILAFERPIREGDQIQLETLTGEVRRIGFRATIVRTFDGAEVIVPERLADFQGRGQLDPVRPAAPHHGAGRRRVWHRPRARHGPPARGAEAIPRHPQAAGGHRALHRLRRERPQLRAPVLDHRRGPHRHHPERGHHRGPATRCAPRASRSPSRSGTCTSAVWTPRPRTVSGR